MSLYLFKNLLPASIIMCLFVAIACDKEPSAPEMDCILNDTYVFGYHFVNAAKAFDIRTDPPTDLKNKTLEYRLSNQLIRNYNSDSLYYPYSEYFIDSIIFLNDSLVEAHIFETDSFITYTYLRDDCEIYLSAPGHELQLELRKGGKELEEQRFAIYDHHSRSVLVQGEPVRLDTFSFLEFYLGPFSSYAEIAKSFAMKHSEEYDTIGIELIENRTKE